jgi:hypothetical protein
MITTLLKKNNGGNVRFELTAFGFGGQRSIHLS